MRHEAAEEITTPAREPDAIRVGDPDPEATARLVADAARGDETAWETLVRRYSRRIYALAKSRLHDADTAEEIAQSVFATLAVKLRDTDRAHYTETGKFEPWLFRIAMNRVRDEGRRRQRRPGSIEIGADLGTVPIDSDPDRTGSRREIDAMRRAIQTLDDRDREMIELRHHGSLSFAQIADLLGEPIGTCLARHHRAIKKLRARMEHADTGAPSPGGEPHA